MKPAPTPLNFNVNIKAGQSLHVQILIIVLLSFIVLSVSCSQSTQTAQPKSNAIEVTGPSSTPRMQSTPSPLPSNTATLITEQPPERATTTPSPTCPDQHGIMDTRVVRDPRLFREMPIRIYLPPCYDQNPEQFYPTLYLLHGLQSTESQWDELGVDEIADKLISNGTLPPFIIVMPWHRTGIDLIQSVPEILVPYIEANFAANAERTYRAIGGVSKGGGQALEIGLKYSNVFAAVGMHSPAVPFADAIIADWLLNIPDNSRPSLWIDIGARDSLFPAAQSLIGNLQANGIPITLQLDDGDHNSEYWKIHIEGYLRWYAMNWPRASFRTRVD